jgi:hypothetical protein
MATTIFCSKTGLLNIRQHEAILIVDCGKGTVDLTAYEVMGENPLKVKELTPSTGDSCG